MSGEQILDEAIRMLARGGYAGLSLRSLARSLGVSLATVQRHFATKDELWRAAVDQLVESRAGDATGERSAHAELTGQFRRVIATASRRPGITAAIWNDSAPGAADRLDYLSSRAVPALHTGRERLREAIEAGFARPVSIEALQALIGLGITSLASSPEALRRLFGIDVSDSEQLEALADGLADIVVNGVVRADPADRPD